MDDQAPRRQTAVAILAVLVVVGFLGALWIALGLEKVSEPALLLLGGLGSAFGAVINYYFGSSLGSAVKTTLLKTTLPGGK